LNDPVEVVERAGLTLIFENCPHTYLAYGSLTRRVIEALGSKRLRALWDPGNALRSGGSPYPADYLSVEPYIAHVHPKDLVIGGRPRIVPFGEGDIDCRGILGLAGDNVFFFEDLESNLPVGHLYSRAAWFESMDRLRSLADRILPSHDPLLFRRDPSVYP
jgi:hypothetical protein